MSKSFVEKAKSYVETELKRLNKFELDEMHDEEYCFIVFDFYGLDLRFTIVEAKVREGEGNGINIMIEACKSEGKVLTFSDEFGYCPYNYTASCFTCSFKEFKRRFDEGIIMLINFLANWDLPMSKILEIAK